MSRISGRGLLLLCLTLLIPACGGSNNNDKPPNTLAAAPTNLIATAITTARIDLTWTPGSTNEFEFRIERSDDNGATFKMIGRAPRLSTAYSDVGLIPGTIYVYRVTAWNSVGNSPYAGPVNSATLALTWYQTPDAPFYRSEHSAIYDSLGRRMIVFGGVDDIFLQYNEVWELDLDFDKAGMMGSNRWTQLFPSGTPPSERFGHSAIYDVQNDRMIVFGGQDPGSILVNEVYILTLGSSPAWTQVTPSGTPPTGRIGHTAVYDAANQRMVVFGGNDVTGTSEKADCYFLSLPSNNQFAWSPASVGPLKRTEHAAVYDGFRQQMVLFGGLDHSTPSDGSNLNGETWTLPLQGAPIWSSLTFPSTPGLRQGHAAAYDSANERMVFFGGDTTYDVVQTPSSELWALQLTGTPIWLIQNPTSGTAPPARWGHTAVYDSGNARLVIFGGYDSLGLASADTWLTEF